MDYVPWPKDGCGLAEARDRVAGRLLWKRLCEDRKSTAFGEKTKTASAANLEIQHVEAAIAGSCLDLLKAKRLIAYGRLGDMDSPECLIAADQWLTLSRLDWEHSSAGTDEASPQAFFGIRLFPPLLAPCSPDLVGGLSLAEAFQAFVLKDPEVEVLGAEAARVAPVFERVFGHGHCYAFGVKEWPVSLGPWGLGVVHPDPKKRFRLGVSRTPDSIEVVIAAEALIHRYSTLTLMLRTGDLEARGLPAASGPAESILHGVWSHPDFHLDARTGDVLQHNPNGTGFYDRLITRWIGVVLQRKPLPETSRRPAFHVQPTTPHAVLPITTERQMSLKPASKALARVQTTGAAQKACKTWLVEKMRDRPDQRQTIETLWAEARSKWPGTLSHRAFLEVRREAIRETRAGAWAAAGAPKKPRGPQSPR